jgi:hypothetical protein
MWPQPLRGAGAQRRANSTERLDYGGHVARRRELRDQPLELGLSPIAGSGEHLTVVFFGEIRREHDDAGKVDGGIRQHLEQDGKLPSDARGAAAAMRFVLGEAELVDAIGDERVARPPAIRAPGIDLGEVRQHEGAEVIGAADEAFEAVQQRVVVESLNLLESIVKVHSTTIHWCFEPFPAPLGSAFLRPHESCGDRAFKRDWHAAHCEQLAFHETSAFDER